MNIVQPRVLGAAAAVGGALGFDGSDGLAGTGWATG